MSQPTGYVIYKGKSELNGKPIVVIAITKSKNVKTGNMVQTYILADNGKSPLDNIRTLEDDSICGICPHRRGLGGACYVNIGQGVTAVYKAYKRNLYPQDILSAKNASKGRIVRLGTYGDPAAVPRYVWDNLLLEASGHTGYTHQWKNDKSQNIMDLVMASADSIADKELANKKGYRTFRVRLDSEPLLQNEFICPASEEAGKKKQCQNCKACSGTTRKNQASPVIITHGILSARLNKTNGLGFDHSLPTPLDNLINVTTQMFKNVLNLA